MACGPERVAEPVEGLDRPLAADQGGDGFGGARVASRLVTPSAATSEMDVPSRAVTYRSAGQAWLACGNGRSPGAGRTWMVRDVG
jgi:hypothetical protein